MSWVMNKQFTILKRLRLEQNNGVAHYRRVLDPNIRCSKSVAQNLVSQTIDVIARFNPLILLMTELGSLNCKLANWSMLLSRYDMQFTLQKVIKGQVIADILTEHSILESSKLYDDILNEIVEVIGLLKNKFGNYALTKLLEVPLLQ